MSKKKSVRMANEISKTGELTWKLEEDGCLVVSGSGRMCDFTDAKPAPWACEAEQIEKVCVEEGVENIGAGAFSGFVNLKTAELGADVDRIGWRAFFGCTSLTRVNLSRRLQHWRIPRPEEEPVILMGHRAFGETPWQEQQNLDVLIHDGVLLEYFGGKETVTVPEGVREIAPMAFEDKPLREVILPKSLEVIGACAFANTDLRQVMLHRNLKRVDGFAFVGNSLLQRVWFETLETKIHPKAFWGTPVSDADACAYGHWLLGRPENRDLEDRFAALDGRKWTAAQLRRLLKDDGVILYVTPYPKSHLFSVTSLCYFYDGILREYYPSPCLDCRGPLGDTLVRADSLEEWRRRYRDPDTWLSLNSEGIDWIDKEDEISCLEALLRHARKGGIELYHSWDKLNFYGPLELMLTKQWLDTHPEYRL